MRLLSYAKCPRHNVSVEFFFCAVAGRSTTTMYIFVDVRICWGHTSATSSAIKIAFDFHFTCNLYNIAWQMLNVSQKVVLMFLPQRRKLKKEVHM